jgi:hypothetical protein
LGAGVLKNESEGVTSEPDMPGLPRVDVVAEADGVTSEPVVPGLPREGEVAETDRVTSEPIMPGLPWEDEVAETNGVTSEPIMPGLPREEEVVFLECFFAKIGIEERLRAMVPFVKRAAGATGQPLKVLSRPRGGKAT